MSHLPGGPGYVSRLLNPAGATNRFRARFTCDCIAHMDRALSQNRETSAERVACAFTLDGVIKVAVYADSVTRTGNWKRGHLIDIQFCPFCGREYAPKGDASNDR